MTTLSGNISVTLNGVTNFNVGSDAYSWSAKWLLSVDTWVRDDLGPFVATYAFGGSSWWVEVMRFTGNVRAVINDNASGATIGNLLLESIDGAGLNKVVLRNTFVDAVKGSNNVEQITLGAAGATSLNLRGGNDVVTTGTGLVEYINVGLGNNQVTVGAGGAVTILSGTGNDTLRVTGSAEAEYIDSGRGNDVITTGAGWVGTVIGSRGRDSITIGSGGASVVVGGRDADTVKLSKLADPGEFIFVDGGEGASDNANRDSDTLVLTVFNKKLDIDLGQNDTVNTGYGTFLFRNFEHVSSGSSNDVLKGNNEVNIIRGNGGNDLITGRGGADDLFGGAGADVFVYSALSDSRNLVSGRDTIFDFTSVDRIDLRGMDANSKMAGNQAFAFVNTKGFSGAAGELRYVKQASDTYIYGDVNGDRQADFTIHLDDAVTLLKSYFLL